MYFRYGLVILSWLLLQVTAIPVPTDDSSSSESGRESPAPFPVQHYNHGDIVGVRPSEYELNPPKEISIHPGVVVDGPKENGKYGVAMISKKLPHDPPQQNVKDFHPHTSLYGNVALSPEKEARPEGMKPWKSEKTGKTEVSMPDHGVEALKTAMVPHAGWREPSPPPPPIVPPSTPRPGFQALHPGHNAALSTDPNALQGAIPPKPKKKRKRAQKKKAADRKHPGGSTPAAPSAAHDPAHRAAEAQRKARHPALSHRLSPSRNHSPSRSHASAHASVHALTHPTRGGHPIHVPSRGRSRSPVGRHPPPQRGRSPRRSPPPNHRSAKRHV